MKNTSDGPYWLARLEKKMPEVLRKAEIRILLRTTASACGQKAPSLRGKSAEESLAFYRDFTVRTLAGKSTEELSGYRENMYRKAFRLGRLLGILPGLREEKSRRRLIVLLYRNIEITLEDEETEGREDESGSSAWRIRIPRCYFSPAYTPVNCHVMSGFDAGIICGVLGGGNLTFRRRLTEGCRACSACWQSY